MKEMAMNAKHEIIIGILELCLPRIRNLLSSSLLIGARKQEAQELSQLIHSLYLSLQEDEACDNDVWFLNVHAKRFIFEGKGNNSPLYDSLYNLIYRLYVCVKLERPAEMTWSLDKPSSKIA